MATIQKYKGRPRTFLKPEDEKVKDNKSYHREWRQQNKQSAVCEICGSTVSTKYNMRAHQSTLYCSEFRKRLPAPKAALKPEAPPPPTHAQLPQLPMEIINRIKSFVPKDRNYYSDSWFPMKLYLESLVLTKIEAMRDIDWKVYSVLIKNGDVDLSELRYIQNMPWHHQYSLAVCDVIAPYNR
jgi:hypothetical protein